MIVATESDFEPEPLRLQEACKIIATEPDRALEELQYLAEQGSIRSMVYLGCAFRDGTGRKVDTLRAIYWFQRAGHLGSSRAMFYLGCLYWRLNNYEKAREVLSESAELGYAPAMYWLAELYESGPKETQNLPKALSLLERSAKLGHIYAKRDLGIILMDGRGGLFGRLRGVFVFLSGLIDMARTARRDPSSQRLLKNGAW